MALIELERPKPPRWVKEAVEHDRLFYVGVSKHMVDRLHEHAIGTGPDFTQVFPPVRLLNIDWYSTLSKSIWAKPKKADYLDRDFPDAFVYSVG
jgi:predicted GIY-YIG superfamily endonuclease